MLTIALFVTTPRDSFCEGPNQQFDPFVDDADFRAFSAGRLDAADDLVFGRVTYDGMSEHWPSRRLVSLAGDSRAAG